MRQVKYQLELGLNVGLNAEKLEFGYDSPYFFIILLESLEA